MPDTKISDLTNGTPPQDADEFPVRRGTDNNKLSWANMRAALAGQAVVRLDTSAQTLAVAQANSTDIQAALTAAGGHVVLVGQGVAAVTGTHTLHSNTTLEVSAGLHLLNMTHLSGSNVPMFRNANWVGAKVSVSSITDAATSPALTGLRDATVTCGAAHGLTVGQYALIKGDTTRRYLGIFQVKAVPTTTTLVVEVTGNTSGVGAGAGSMTIQRADANITLTGDGTIDYNGQLNQADYGFNAHTCLFNKVRTLRVENVTFLDGIKYAIYWGNLQHARFVDLTIYGASAAIQGIGFGLDIVHQNIMGTTADDFLAYTGDNTGYEEFNPTNGDMDNGPLIGFTVRDVHCYRTGVDVVAVYGGAPADEISGVLIDGIQATQAARTYVYLDAPAGIPSTFRDVTIRNVRGQPALGSYAIRVGGQGTLATVDSLVIERFDFGVTPTPAFPIVFASRAVIGKLTIDGDGSHIRMDSTGGQRYLCQIDSFSTALDVTIRGITLTNTAGAAGTYALSHSGAARNIVVEDCKFIGTASAIGGGAPTGSPVIDLRDNYADTFSLASIYFSGTLNVQGNTFGAIGGGAPCLVAYGSGVVCNVRAYGNNWNNANNWLQIGGAAGDTLQTQVWFSGNGSAGGTGTAINFVDTAGTRYLRQSDATQQMNAARWTAIDIGCVYQNNNAAFGAGVGVYVQGATAAQRINTPLTTAQTTAGGVSVVAQTSGGVLLDADGNPIGAAVPDTASLTLTTAMANTMRIAAGTQTYTINAATAWAVSDGAAVFLPASGTVSFAVSGGPTLNGGTTTLTRTLAGNAIGYVVLSRVAGTAAYSLSGA